MSKISRKDSQLRLTTRSTNYEESTENSAEPPLKYGHLPTKVGPILHKIITLL